MKRIILSTLALTLAITACSKAEEAKVEEKPAAAAVSPPTPPTPPPAAAGGAAAADIAPEQADAVAAALEKEIEEDLDKE